MEDFPTNQGFRYNKDYNEWQKLFGDGILILCEDLSDCGTWELSFVDSIDTISSIVIGDEDCIIVRLNSEIII